MVPLVMQVWCQVMAVPAGRMTPRKRFLDETAKQPIGANNQGLAVTSPRMEPILASTVLPIPVVRTDLTAWPV